MDIQFIALAGRIERWAWHPPKQWGGQFGIQFKLPNESVLYGSNQVMLQNQSYWLNVDVSQAQVGKPQFNSVLQTLQGGQGKVLHFLATGARIKTGTKKQRVVCTLSGFRVRDSLSIAINRVVLDVRCAEVRDRWLRVTESYRIPNPKEGQRSFGERHIWVYLPKPMQLTPGQPVYVEGHLALRSPTGDEYVYVIADLVA
jgi:hypothetical protein